jgi:hypothetical protein
MEIHKNWSVTPKGLEKLHSLNEKELKEEIASKNLYGGFPKEYAKKQNALIYGKINNSRVKKETGTVDTSKNKKRNRKDN